MKDIFDQIRDQIHDVRNIVGPVVLRLDDMQNQITGISASVEEKISVFESKLMVALFRINEQQAKIAELTERVSRFDKHNPN